MRHEALELSSAAYSNLLVMVIEQLAQKRLCSPKINLAAPVTCSRKAKDIGALSYASKHILTVEF